MEPPAMEVINLYFCLNENYHTWPGPKFVLYGFIEHHEVRNVALGSWLEGLSLFSRRSYVAVPFATFDPQKGLIRHPPEHYLSLPFRESFAVIPLVARAYMNLKTNQRSLQKRLVTEQILLQMNRVSKSRDATFIIVLLGMNDEAREHYMNFFRVNQIHAIDCVYNLTDELKVPGEGHPNGKMNALWTECIADWLNNQFGEIGAHNAPSTTSSKKGGGQKWGWLRSDKTREEARIAVFEYIEVFYQRRHQSLDYVSPVDYEQSMAVA